MPRGMFEELEAPDLGHDALGQTSLKPTARRADSKGVDSLMELGGELTVTPAAESSRVHLSPAPESRSTLCGLVPMPGGERPHWHAAGCLACVEAALASGYSLARDSDQGWVNLSRFHAAARRALAAQRFNGVI